MFGARRLRASWFLTALCACLGGVGARAQSTAVPSPAAATAARYIPADGLVAYLEYDGLNAHRNAWAQTAAHAVLTQTTTGAMLRSLITQVAGAMLSESDAEAVTADQLGAVFDHVVGNGLAVSIHLVPGEQPTSRSYTIVIPGAGDTRVRDTLERVLRTQIDAEATTQILTRPDGRRLIVVRAEEPQPSWTFWFEKNDLIVSIGQAEQGADRIVATLANPESSLEAHPVRRELVAPANGFESIARAWLDANRLGEIPEAMGLKGLTRADYRWGFQGKELVSVTRILAPQPRKGVLALLDQPPLDATNIPPIPAGVTEYAVASVDLARAFDAIATIAEGVDPGAPGMLKALTDGFKQQTGVGLRDDVLAQLGPRWAFYADRPMIQAPVTPVDAMGAWLFRMPGLIAVAETADPARFGRSLTGLANTANGMLQSTASGDAPPARFDALAAPLQGYRLVVPPHLFPLPTSVDPGLVLGPRHAVLTSSIDTGARVAALGAGTGERVVPDASLLRPGTIFLEVHDARQGTPELIANMPFLMQMLGRMGPNGPFGPRSDANPLSRVSIDRALIPRPDAIRAHLFPGSSCSTVDDQGLTFITRDSFPAWNSFSLAPALAGALLPAVGSAREAAARSQAVNNLKQIALAMHNYLSATNEGFPPQAICDKDGNPLLSWRVAILPYIEQQGLYEEFHLDEPWDSEHNKTLIDKMPAVYGVPPTRARLKPGHTFAQVLVGNGALFEADTPVGIADVADGTSNTILVAEAAKPVVWTQPADLEYDPEEPVPAMGGIRWRGGFNAAFADGSVRFLKTTIDVQVLRALITRAGGEVISADAF